MENHLVDPTEKAENAESSENVTDKRNQKYITPNNRLTIMVQQCAANTRLDEKLQLLQRRQSEQHKIANFNVKTNFLRMFKDSTFTRDKEVLRNPQKSAKFPEMP